MNAPSPLDKRCPICGHRVAATICPTCKVPTVPLYRPDAVVFAACVAMPFIVKILGG